MTFDDEQNLIHGLDHQSRAMCSIVAEQERMQLVVGTQTLRSENQISLLELDEDSNQMTRLNFLHNEGEIWHLSSCPSDGALVSSCFSRPDGSRLISGCAVWRMNRTEIDRPDVIVPLQSVSQLTVPNEVTHISCFNWQPTGNDKAMAVCNDGSILVVDAFFQGRHMQIVSEIQPKVKTSLKATAGRWNPHHNCNVVAVAANSWVKAWDIRSMQLAFKLENCHSPVVRDLDFNTNRQYILATCGDDCKIRFWDSRKVDQPLKTIGTHSHWVWSVRFNPVHDQLVLSCSSDATMLLHSAVSISSESTNDDEDDDEEQDDARESEGLEDGLVYSLDEHEESVYCCDWAANDPWLFASLSYDGRLIVSKVPRKVKYQILKL